MIDEAKTNRYKELLIRRDTLKKECELIWLQYVKTFGTLLETLFRQKIECIALKKKITYCQSRQNRKESVDFNEMERSVQAELTDYYDALKEICEAKDVETTPVSPCDMLQIKKLYRKIASLIHPDLHPELFQRRDIQELWQQAKAAYASNDLAALQDAEFLILEAIGSTPDCKAPEAIENIDKRIAALQEEIAQIIATQPYQYKFILLDSSLVAEEQQLLTEEIASYQSYRQELQEHYQELLDYFAQFTATEVFS